MYHHLHIAIVLQTEGRSGADSLSDQLRGGVVVEAAQEEDGAVGEGPAGVAGPDTPQTVRLTSPACPRAVDLAGAFLQEMFHMWHLASFRRRGAATGEEVVLCVGVEGGAQVGQGASPEETPRARPLLYEELGSGCPTKWSSVTARYEQPCSEGLIRLEASTQERSKNSQ